jgi:hypothetical protein
MSPIKLVERCALASLVSVLAGCIPPPHAPEATSQKVAPIIFGPTDDRKDLHDLPPDLSTWKWADATALLTVSIEEDGDLDTICKDSSTEDNCSMDTVQAYKDESLNLCLAGSDAQNFARQSTVDRPRRTYCTAFLVGEDLMVTASHCLQGEEQGQDTAPRCSQVEISFGFNTLSHRTDNSVIRRNDLYTCREIVARNSVVDYTLFRVERAVIGHHRLRVRRDGDANVTTDTRLVKMGHGLGFPLKIDDRGRVRDPQDGRCNPSAPTPELCHFHTDTDGFKGDSGAPMINPQTGFVEGINLGGPEPGLIASGMEPEIPPGDIGLPCNVYGTCGQSGCSSGARWNRILDIKAIDPDLIPELLPAGVHVNADFDNDQEMDVLSVAGQNGTFHLRVDWGDIATPAFDYDTMLATNLLPPGLDLAWSVTVRDFNGDGHDDVISNVPGFSPILLHGTDNLARLQPPSISPFGVGVSYGGFTVTDFNGDAIVDLLSTNLLTGAEQRFYGTPTGLARGIATPDDCIGGPAGQHRPRALAILPPSTLLTTDALAVFDCPGPDNLNRIAFMILSQEVELRRDTLTTGGNWRGFAFRRDSALRLDPDMLGVSMGGTADAPSFSVHQISLSGPTITSKQLFSQALAPGEEASGITWNEQTGRIAVLITEQAPDASRIDLFIEDGTREGSHEFDDCRRTFEEREIRGPTGLAGSGSKITVACLQGGLGALETRLLGIEDGAVSEDGIYIPGPHLLTQGLSDIECDPFGGALWGLSTTGRFFFVKQTNLTDCPVPLLFSFNALPSLASGEWTSAGQPLPVSATHQLVIAQPGYTAAAGPLFETSALRRVGDAVAVDVLVPRTPAAPAWAGAVQLYMSTPAIPNQYVGQKELSPLVRGQWHTLTFPLTAGQHQTLLGSVRDVSFSIAVNRPQGAEPTQLSNLRFAGAITVRESVPSEDPYDRAPVFGFENATAWRSTQATLSQAPALTQGSASLQVQGNGWSEIKSRTFRTNGLVPSAALKLDVRVPTQQPNPYWFGDMSAFISCPSANLHNAFLASRPLTGLAAGTTHTLSFAVPSAVGAALSGPRNDCTVTLALNVPAGAGAYRLDNLRF